MAENNSSAPLLPCPFCGAIASAIEHKHANDCYFTLHKQLNHEAKQETADLSLIPAVLQAWNTRAPYALTTPASSRDAFEAWVPTQHMRIERWKPNPELYDDENAISAWQGWEAGVIWALNSFTELGHHSGSPDSARNPLLQQYIGSQHRLAEMTARAEHAEKQAACLKDQAARYQWLRNDNDWHVEPRIDEADGTIWKLTFYSPNRIDNMHGDDGNLDAAIDAAMAPLPATEDSSAAPTTNAGEKICTSGMLNTSQLQPDAENQADMQMAAAGFREQKGPGLFTQEASCLETQAGALIAQVAARPPMLLESGEPWYGHKFKEVQRSFHGPCVETGTMPEVLPNGWVPCTITYEGQYPEDVAYGPKIMMDRLKKWLERYFALKTEVQAEPVAKEVACLRALFEAADKGMHSEAARGDRLAAALRGMLQLDEENHQRYAGDEDVCKEVRDAKSALAYSRSKAPQAQPADALDAALIGDCLPMQPVIVSPDTGVYRFKENRIVTKLLSHSELTGYSLNEIARDFNQGMYSADEQMQLAQLIGYSVDGYGTLSYVTDESYQRAAAMAAAQEGGNAAAGKDGAA